jgi:thiosulfate dehydrogenase
MGMFVPPDTAAIPHDDFGEMVRYGRNLMWNTAYYIGPDGIAGHYLGNKINCTNCHVDAGTRPYGFNFFSTHARYPQYRGRENQVLDLAQRVNNCIERPNNGRPLPLDSKEMVAMLCYMKWLGTNVPVGQHAKGDEMPELEYPKRAADPVAGGVLYQKYCTECHGAHGEGRMRPDSVCYLFPPVWGPLSYQKGSSPSRVLKLARFLKANMPDKKTSWQKPLLSDEQAIDIAAFVNCDSLNPRPPKKDPDHPDYANTAYKAIDYDKGPYVDTFSERQHKYGPYQPIVDYHKAHNLPVIF